jgi:hypothetical protein
MNPIRLAIHGAMLADHYRNQQLARAIAAVVRPGDVVIDVGAGSGLLSMLAARTGARAVYALECGPMAEVARHLVHANGLEGVITVEPCHSTQWQAPEPANAILCETLGFAIFDEGFRESLTDARERMLAPGGTLVPCRLRTFAVPVSPIENLPHLGGLNELCGFDFRPLTRLLRAASQRAYVPVENELANRAELWDLDCYTMPASELMDRQMSFTIHKTGLLGGFLLWFEADLGGGISLGNRCPHWSNHWGQLFLAAKQQQEVCPGDDVRLQIRYTSASQFTWSECAQRA